MAGLNVGYAYLEDIELYGPPNAALAEILIGAKMYAIVAEYTAKVLGNYVTRQSSSVKSTRHRKYRPAGQSTLESLEMTVDIGGFKKDRWTGQITVGVEYALASEYGRKKYAPYAGNKNLREALYGVLPHRP